MALRSHPLDGALLRFNPRTGVNVLLPNVDSQRVAPRVIQVGLLTPCNLSCSFCYRDAESPSLLKADFLEDLLCGAADWGVLEVAFGGGEPLLFPGFTRLVRRLRERTPLAVSFTTNGTLLTPAAVEQLRGAAAEIRVSAYPDNRYRKTLRMLAGESVGVNWLVTPANVGLVEPTVRDFLQMGARNVLLLGYKGPDTSLHLSQDDMELLCSAVRRSKHLPLRLDICWYPRLADVPHLFSRSDCGAGDDFLVITPDQAIQACSFQRERMPFTSLEDLKRIYAELRLKKPAADVAGCTRSEFGRDSALPRGPKAHAYIWSAFSSNNSGDWTIVGEFRTEASARAAAESLRELARAHEAFLASPEGHAWLEENEFMGDKPTPPLRAFGKVHGFNWEQEGEGLWWEEDGCGAPVLTAGAVGTSVVVYHPYCMGLPKKPFEEFFRRVGGILIGYWEYDCPRVVAHATGSNPAAISEVRRYIELATLADHPWRVKAPPPWGAEAEDPRLAGDEDRSAQLSRSQCDIRETPADVTMAFSFENTFAGAVALERWLKASGFDRINVRIEAPLEQIEVDATPGPARTGLFEASQPIERRVEAASPDELVHLVFKYATIPPVLLKAVVALPDAEANLRLLDALRKWPASNTDMSAPPWSLLKAFGRRIEQFARQWLSEVAKRSETPPPAAISCVAAALPHDEAFLLAETWMKCPRQGTGERSYLLEMGCLRDLRTLKLIETEWRGASPLRPIDTGWDKLAAESGIDWIKARDWIAGGRPLSIISLEAMWLLARGGVPGEFGRPQKGEFETILREYALRDPAPRVERAVAQLIQSGEKFTRA